MASETSNLPYSDPEHPADAADVAREIAEMTRLNAAVVAMVAARLTTPLGVDPRRLSEEVAKLKDPKTEPGQSLFVQETRLALALLSFVGGEVDAFAKILAETAREATDA